MTGRDRIVAMVVAVVVALGAAWLLVVSPERNKATKLNEQVASARSQLQTAENTVANARGAQAQYAAAYSSIVHLGKAVPASQEVPSLIYQLAHASNTKDVAFASIVSGTGGSASTASSTAAAATSAGFTQMSFTFIFNGTFFDLEHLFHNINGFTVRSASGELHVSGRLLTIQAVKLAPLTEGIVPGKSTSAIPLTGTITATAYILPASQGLTGGATAAAPAGAGTATASTGSNSGPPAAVAQVTP